jgi:hypothetical protein
LAKKHQDLEWTIRKNSKPWRNQGVNEPIFV